MQLQGAYAVGIYTLHLNLEVCTSFEFDVVAAYCNHNVITPAYQCHFIHCTSLLYLLVVTSSAPCMHDPGLKWLEMQSRC